MGWLSSGGTPFAYRMSVPVTNPLAAGDRQLTLGLPGPYLRAAGKIQQASFADVHVTKSDGTTELPCALYFSNTGLCVDFANMAQGRTTVYVYYGHASAAAPGLPSFIQGESGGAMVDFGFDWGTQGVQLSDAVWPTSGNAPSAKIHDHTYPNQGNPWSMEAKITAGASALYYGVAEAQSNVSGAGSEFRFWVRFNETTTYKTIAGGNPQVFYIRFKNDGTLEIYTDRTATGYTQSNYTSIGTYAANQWWEYRLVFDFANATYTLSRRQLVTDAWTQLKSAGAPNYNIPMRATGSLTTMAGTSWLGYQNAIWWMDAIKYSSAPITDVSALWTLQTIGPNQEKSSEGDTGAVVYIFGPDIEATYLDSSNATTYYGAAAAHKVGVTTGGVKYHAILKHFEGLLPKGTVASAKLHLYLESNANIGEATTLLAHRLKSTARSGGTLADDWAYYVRTGWTLQASKSRPTWNTRFCSLWLNYPTGADIAWETAGAIGTDEVNLAEHADLALAPGFTVGYKDFTVPTTWIDDWLGDGYCSGLLLKDSTDSAGANNRHTLITAQGQVNSPVLEVVYSALAGNQLTKRKLTTDTYNYATFSVHNRYVILPSENWMGVVGWVNNELKVSLAYISPDGRISSAQRDSAPASGALNGNSPGFGFYYDASENRLWFVGVDSAGYLCVAYCAVGLAGGTGSWTWKTHGSVSAAKGTAYVTNGVIHIVYYRSSTSALTYIKYTRATDTWATPVALVSAAVGGTQRAIASAHAIGASDVMMGAGELYANGSVADYPSHGGVKIDSEYFWYAAKDVGASKLTGVTRAMFGSTAADHAVGATIGIDRAALTYSSMSYDSIRNCLHLSYVVNSSSPTFAYLYSAYLRHVLSDADNVWKDEAGNAVTLAVDQRTERLAGPPGICCYCTGNHLNSDGDLLLANLRWYGIGPAGFGYARPYISRLLHNGTTFSHIDTSLDMVECAFLDMGSGLLKITGLNTSDKTAMLYSDSADNGATWAGAVITVSTHTFPYYLLWCSSCAQTAYLNTYSMMYAQHFAEHGAIWLNALAVGPPVTPVARKYLLDVMADGWIGRKFPALFEVTASIGRGMRLPFSFEALVPIGRAFPLEVDWLQGIGRRFTLPTESAGDLVVVRRFLLPVEVSATLARKLTLPVEAAAGLRSRKFVLPVEIRTGVGRRYGLPIEWSGDRILRRKFLLPLETRQRITRKLGLPVEAAGLTDALADLWNVYRTLSEVFVDEWTVIPVAQAVDFVDAWNVQSAMGMEFIDTWRVLPQQIIALFSGDIQLPSATMEKD